MSTKNLLVVLRSYLDTANNIETQAIFILGSEIWT
jgi:hypothetical protein